jgi:AraC-like DNA-binding protein
LREAEGDEAISARRHVAGIASARFARLAMTDPGTRRNVENVCSRELTIVSLAERHQVTPRYVRKLFEGEGVTFSEFVLAQRLARARRLLADVRHDAETISAIAFASGFGDLSYFNRVFRRQYGATPTAVREGARTGEAMGATDPMPGGSAAAGRSAVGG